MTRIGLLGGSFNPAHQGHRRISLHALRRLGLDDAAATEFFEEHVTADAVHESIAAVDLAGGLVAQEPALAADVLWGARTLAALEARWGSHLLDAWADGRSSLRIPLAEPATA
jgi:hypothetical protein